MNSNGRLFLTLLRNELKRLWGSIKYRKNRSRLFSSGIAAGLIAAGIVAMLCVQSYGQTVAFIEAGVPEYGIFMGVMMSFLLMTMFMVMRSTGEEKSTDAGLLLSLPIPRPVIIVAKSLMRYVYYAVPALVILLPPCIFYYLLAEKNLFVPLRGFLAVLLLPLIIVAVSFVLDAAIEALSNRFRAGKLIRTALVLLVLGGYFALSFSGALVPQPGAAPLSESSFPLGTVTALILRGNALSMLLFAALAAAMFAGGVMFFSRGYGQKIAVASGRGGKIQYRRRSPFRSLLHKEIRFYLGCTIYLINTIVGPLLLLMFAGAMLFQKESIFAQLFSIPEVAGMRFPVILAVLCAIASMTCSTNASISLEGKRFWILRVNPLPPGTVFAAKIALNLLLYVPAQVVVASVISLSMGLSPVETAALIVAPALCSLTIACLGLYVNLLLPRFDWESETVVVKQSMSVMFSLFGGMLLVALPFVAYFMWLHGMSVPLMAALVSGYFALCAGGLLALLSSHGRALYLRMAD